jgi:hypothetical protein
LVSDSKPSLKAKAFHEFVRFTTMFAYLWVMFLLLQLHQYIVLAQHQIPFTQYGVGLFNALWWRRSCWWPTTFGSANGGDAGDGP